MYFKIRSYIYMLKVTLFGVCSASYSNDDEDVESGTIYLQFVRSNKLISCTKIIL